MLKLRGFTLIEIMITVAIIAILAAVGYPSYADFVRRGKISEAISGLSSARVNMERWFQDNRTYAGACPTTTKVLPDATSNFSFSCVGTPDAATYVVQAQGLGSMSEFRYTVNQSNTKSTAHVPAGWAGQGNACWVLKKDGSC